MGGAGIGSRRVRHVNADPLIVDTASRMLSELCGAEVVTAAEDGTWPGALWDALEESALTRAWIPERLGGPGTGLADGFTIVRLAGTHAVPAPLAETLLAGWLASEADLEAPEGPLTVAPVDAASSVRLDGDALVGSATRVPYARACGHLAVVFREGDAGTGTGAWRSSNALPVQWNRGRRSPASRAIPSSSTESSRLHGRRRQR